MASAIVNIRQQDMDLSNYIGQIASLKEEFLTLMPLASDVGAQHTQVDKFFMVLTLIGLRPNLETVRDQILGSPSVPSLDDVFACLLRISSTQTLPSDSPLDSFVLVSHTNLRGGRSGNRGRGQRPHCTYCNKLGHTRDRCYQLHGRPPRTAHVTQSSDSDSQPPQTLISSTSKGIPPTDSEYDVYLCYQAAKSASIASVAQTGNASVCLTHTSSLGPWILDSGASDHIFGNKDLFSSLTTTPTLPTVTLTNGSQSTLGFQYFVTFIDDYSRCTWLFLMKNRAELYSIFQKFYAEILTQFNISIRVLRSDNAREYFSAPFISFMSQHGILHQSSCAHTP